MTRLTALLLAVQAYAVHGQKVQVDFHYEVGCPTCAAALSSPAGFTTLVAAKMADKVDIKLHPWGNTYFAIAECGGTAQPLTGTDALQNPDPRYNAANRECWDSKCGLGATAPPADCYTGEMISQHGGIAGAMAVYAVCGSQAAGADWQSNLKFAVCMDDAFKTATGFSGSFTPKEIADKSAQSCATKLGWSFGHLKACKAGPGKAALLEEAKNIPPHKAVPFLAMNGKVQTDAGTDISTMMMAIYGAMPKAAARRLITV
jgi:hypothetical protein